MTREIDAIEQHALDWVRGHDQVLYTAIDMHLDGIKDQIKWGDAPHEAIADVLGTEWRNGPPGFTSRETELDTIAMAMLARDSIRWDRVVLMWIAMNPSEHERLEGLVS